MRRQVATWIGFAVSIALVVHLVLRFDMTSALEALRLADLRWFALATVLYTSAFPLRGLRWFTLLRDVETENTRISLRTATEVLIVGTLANNVLPARLGDVARAMLLTRRSGVPTASTFSNIMLERIFDGLTVAGILGAVLWLEPPTEGWVRPASYAVSMVFVSAAVVSFGIAWQRELMMRILRALTAWLPFQAKLLEIVDRLADGLAPLRNLERVAKIGILSACVWGVELSVYIVAQRAFGLDLSAAQLALVMSMLTFGLMAPSAPGFVGVYEGLVIAALALYGVGEPLGPAFAIGMHLVQFSPGTVLGLLFAWRGGFKLRELRDSAPHGG